MSVEFEEQKWSHGSSYQPGTGPSSSIDRYLVSLGIAKNSTQSKYILIVSATIITVIFFIFISSFLLDMSARKPKSNIVVPQGNKLINIKGAPPKLESPVN